MKYTIRTLTNLFLVRIMWMWTLEENIETKAKTESIWALWADVASWPQWDESLTWSKLEGPFAIHTKGTVKPKGWPVASFSLTRVDQNQGFTNSSPMPLTTMEFHHQITPLEDGTLRITHRAEVRGLLAPLFYLTMRCKLKKGLAKSLQSLVKKAEMPSIYLK